MVKMYLFWISTDSRKLKRDTKTISVVILGENQTYNDLIPSKGFNSYVNK